MSSIDRLEQRYAKLPTVAEIHQNAVDHGWYDGVTVENMGPDFIPSKLALIHSELSEGLEGYRKHGIREGGIGEGSLPEELADAVIRIFDLAGFLGIDLEKYVSEKHEHNKSRPYRHGNKVV